METQNGLNGIMKNITKCSRLQSALGVVKKTKLIECVKHRPCLWDHKREDFKSSAARQNAFNEIVNELSDYENQFTRTQMQEEWGKIRYCFTRIIRKIVTTNDDVDAISWPHWEDMQFMYDQIKGHLLANKKEAHKSPGIYANASNMLKSRNTRKRRIARAALARTCYTKRQQIGENGQCSVTTLAAASQPPTSNGPISQAAANALYHLGLRDASLASTSTTSCELINEHPALNSIKAEQFAGVSMTDEEQSTTSADNSPIGEIPKSTCNWDTFVTSIQSKNDSLNALIFPPNSSVEEPVKKQNHSHNPVNVGDVFNRNAEFRNNLPSIESSDLQKTESGNEKDTNDFFGKYMTEQMRSVSKRNPTLGILLRKELMEVCCKYELQTFP